MVDPRYGASGSLTANCFPLLSNEPVGRTAGRKVAQCTLGTLRSLHVVAPQHSVLADVQLAVGQGRIGPRLLVAVDLLGPPRWGKPALLGELVRLRLGHHHLPVLPVQVQPTIGEDYR